MTISPPVVKMEVLQGDNNESPVVHTEYLPPDKEAIQDCITELRKRFDGDSHMLRLTII